MNTTTLNMTTLDGGIIIKRGEGGGGTPTPPSGGDVLEGEYFLAKPNGKYKKITFINGYVDSSKLSEDQLMAMLVIANVQSQGFCYSGFVCTAGSGNGLNKQNFVEGPILLACKIGKGVYMWQVATSDDNTATDDYELNDGTCFAWEERDVSHQGVTYSFIELAQTVLTEIFGYEPSVEEVYAFLQIEDVDKAVYDEWKNRER